MKGVVFLALVVTVSSYSAILDYTNQGKTTTGWDATTCWSGNEQSPIDVRRPDWARNMTEDFEALSEVGSNLDVDLLAKAANNALKYGFDSTIEVALPMIGNRLLDGLHFHWSQDDDTGSEHAIEGQKYGVEMHLVTKKTDDTDYAVINRFFKVVSDDEADSDANEELAKMLDTNSWASPTKVTVDVGEFFEDITEYICYNGSFTTPDCDEDVAWFIIPEPLKISESQMATLRRYNHSNDDGEDFVGNNIRELQDINNRAMMWFKHEDHVDARDSEEWAHEDLECRDGEGITYQEDKEHWRCEKCPRGEFGWKNKCLACPPGKSTINSGSDFRDCIDTRYIKCEMHDSSQSYSYGDEEMESGMVCERWFCPCNAYETCEYDQYDEEYGMCRFADSMNGAGGVTVSALLVAACLAYFGL